MGPAEILATLAEAATRMVALAAVWHFVLLVALIAALRGWRPPARLAALLLVVPLVSVSAVAWAFGNPFNGAMLLALSVLLGGIALQLVPDEHVEPSPVWAEATGIALIALGWIYPHFLDEPALYLAAAPLGVLPCPTLLATIGVSLLCNGLSSRAWSLALGAAGVFYGLFGAVRLNVWLDVVLFAGALALCVPAAAPRERHA